MSRRCGYEVSRTRVLRSVAWAVPSQPATATFERRGVGGGVVGRSEVSRGAAPQDVSGSPAVFMADD